MAPALPFIGAGLGIYSAIKGGQQQGKATRDYEQQLAQQQMIRNMVLGRLTQGPAGAVGNPFSQAYGPITPASQPAPVAKRPNAIDLFGIPGARKPG